MFVLLLVIAVEIQKNNVVADSQVSRPETVRSDTVMLVSMRQEPYSAQLFFIVQR